MLEAHDKSMIDKSISPISHWETQEYNLNV